MNYETGVLNLDKASVQLKVGWQFSRGAGGVKNSGLDAPTCVNAQDQIDDRCPDPMRGRLQADGGRLSDEPPAPRATELWRCLPAHP